MFSFSKKRNESHAERINGFAEISKNIDLEIIVLDYQNVF